VCKVSFNSVNITWVVLLVSKRKILVGMWSFATANNLVSNSQFAINKLRAFISTYHTFRSGIVKNVPLEEETINSNIEAPYRIVKVHRWNHKTRIGNEIKHILSRTVCVKFSGQIFYRFVALYDLHHEVLLYVTKALIAVKASLDVYTVVRTRMKRVLSAF